ncbi:MULTISPECIES: peptidoglycan-binding protein [unclassified Anabaena]|uniref:peptidoglycan-binding protein n=1 Tax=unclassified Anabaena TaxID=2619674 RepID=UPI0039C76007
MDNLAYFHLADAYEDSASSDLVSLSSLLTKASAPDWKRLSSRAWKHMLPLALTLAILGSVSSVLALERGDQGPSVRSLQQKLQQAGFYQSPITQIYDFPTEDAVRRFQQANGLPVDGIVGPSTRQKLDNWQPQQTNNQPAKPSTANTPVPAINTTSPQPPRISTASTPVPPVTLSNLQPPKPTPASTPFETINTTSTPAPRPPSTASTPTQINSMVRTQNKRRHPNLLVRGDEGEEVRALQQQLQVAGFYFGNATGVFGPITEEAVRRFQAAYNLGVDGVVGPATVGKLPPVGVGGEAPTIAARPTATTNRDNLTIGDRGEAVRLLQEHLISAGYLHGTPNGYFGSYTADAVRRFQAANYLAASGIAGPTTRAKLYEVINTAPKSDFSVLEIQRRLQEKGFYKGNLNGVMADDTRRAIQQAQEFYGISLSDIRSGRF